MALALSYTRATTYSLAAQHNSRTLFSNLKLEYCKEDDKPQEVLREITVKLSVETDLLVEEVWRISQLSPGESIVLQERKLRLDTDYLFRLSDPSMLKFTFVVEQAGRAEPAEQLAEIVEVLPANFWGGESREPELLAAFVKPNGRYVESLVKKSSVLLENNDAGFVNGYQSNTREQPYMMASALWSTIQREAISYVSPPPSFALIGQSIRLASEMSSSRIGACLDMSILFASCLECMGLNTVIALTKGHAMVGVWLVNSRFPLLTNDDPMELRKRVDSRDLILFESTMACANANATFRQASDQARDLISESNEQEFVYVIDVAQARDRSVRPIPTVEDERVEQEAVQEQLDSLDLPPPMPPVRKAEQQIEETPETRIDTWQRRLLDLTRRNSLLSFRDNSSGIRIFCPDLGRMEDHLADGTTFTFLSSEESPENNRETSRESFRLSTGNDLHKSFALNKLDNSVLLANMTGKKLANTEVNLFRKAKNDLEEGGANTLFIAIGMLSWKENPKDEKSFKAPLILLPVQLTRRSAGARVRLRQLPDEEPLFNLTLIEFLQSDYEIDLSEFREELPQDESGVDVALVWQTVRDKIAEQEGFELVEDCVVASFSFTKYLMWKDLKDRLDDLKKNLFVSHLVDKPQEPFTQTERFLSPQELDKKVKPEDIYTPLNCDSSQLVAVEASAKNQDFVLEGPPGTGKSETIANIIIHNIALGRKVLFVAEKIAALQVVYRRIEKLDLGHLCLELHSNKSNKKAVLDQFRRATGNRVRPEPNSWKQDAAKLLASRQELNDYVLALHKKTKFGLSARQAIARSAKHGGESAYTLSWGSTLDDCQVADDSSLESYMQAAKSAGLAYENVSDLNLNHFKHINAIAWSFAWQVNLIEAASNFSAQTDEISENLRLFASNFNLGFESPYQQQIEATSNLIELVELAEGHLLGFAMGRDVSARLERLLTLSKTKTLLDEDLLQVDHGATHQLIENTPIDEWSVLVEEYSKAWWKRPFTLFNINRKAKKLGWQKFSDLSLLPQIMAAKERFIQCAGLIEEFAGEGLWVGWDTHASHLLLKWEIGKKADSLLRKIIAQSEDPQSLLTSVKTKLVDQQEYLEDSKIFTSKLNAKSALDRLSGAIDRCLEVKLELAHNKTLKELGSDCLEITSHASRLNQVVSWFAAARLCDEMRVPEIVESLQNGRVLPGDAENQFFNAFCNWLVPRMIDNDESLLSFQANAHNSKITDFKLLDKSLTKGTSDHVAFMAQQFTTDINKGEDAKEFSSLSRELQKKTRHKPIRALFTDLGERVLDICPCMMMSPLSVAQFLPADFNAFDLVVFDEASQIPTWDAVGAIARGKNVIVVGDPKQMPPTNFFNAAIDVDSPDEEDLESILDQALAARLPHLRLTGHYRSKHESLIAFSNSKYYENALVTFPSSDTKESSVTIKRVEGVYAKGKGRNNPIEAQAVVREIVRRLSDPLLSKQTIGVVTLNSEQQRTIEDLLDDARRKTPEIESYFHASENYDPVFVKNLESVQGDERDVILFSLGYGPTEPGSKSLSMNFGPLNKFGGERRLNVAITRATTEVVLFASFGSESIDLGRTSAQAVQDLKHYMEFAERGPRALAEQAIADQGVDHFDSDFEEAVAWSLRERGWRVQTQIGVGKFRIDLGIVNPDTDGSYLAGVECDGRTYHGSPSARDRDRTRQEVLESLGWNLIRLWSTDFFIDAKSAIDRIDAELSLLLEAWRHSATKRGNDPDSALEQESATPDEIVKDLKAPSTLSEDQFEDATSNGADFSASQYFEKGHRIVLKELAQEILNDYECIDEKVLALEVANRHGLTRTSKKQLEHLRKILKPWAGLLKQKPDRRTYWSTPDKVTAISEWRGLDPFGEERPWTEIALPEALGLARLAIQEQPSDPVDYIFRTFGLQRRRENTKLIFESWVDQIKSRQA